MSASPSFVNGNGLLFDPYNPKDLAKKAVLMLKDGKLLKKMSERSTQIVGEFDIKESVNKLERAYLSLLS